MSCGGGCGPQGNSNSADQAKSRKSRCASETESNGGGSCGTSEMPSCDECICDQDNMDDCCGPPIGSQCGGNATCGGGSKAGGYQGRSSGSQGQRRSYGQQGMTGAGQNRMSGQGGMGAQNRMGGPSLEPKKPNCGCGSSPPPMSGGTARQPSDSQRYSQQKRMSNGAGPNNQWQGYQGRSPNNGMGGPQISWNQMQGTQSPSFNQRVLMNQQAQEVGMRGQQNQYYQNGQNRTGSQDCPAVQTPKQIIAPCCFPNKSAMSLIDKTSQRTMSATPSKTSGCPCNEFPKPTPEPGDFVCPSCAEFENPREQETCDEPMPPPPVFDCPPPEPPPQGQPPCMGMESEPEPECEEEKPKKKMSGAGFWQQLQFQVLQQQDGDDAGQDTQDPCLCDASQNGDMADKSKKSGKVWQQLTLDIFQSKDDEGSDNECDSKQGWQQQLKLQIFQEKIGGDDQADAEPVVEDGGCDQCTC